MKRIGIVFIAMFLACSGARGFILDEEIFDHDSVDPLAPSDGHGVLHQMPRCVPLILTGDIGGVGSITSKRMSN
jgi:hypothetical protein